MRNAALLICAFALVVGAQEPRPMIRSSLSPEGDVMVGQPVRLTVDVLVSTWFTGAPEFPRMEIPGAIVVLPEERALNLTESIGDETWSGIRRSFLIYPQEPREFQTSPAEVVVKMGGGTGDPVRIAIPVQTFRATVPDEAAGLGYFIPTTRFQITQKVAPGVEDLKAGDSIQRTVTMTADGAFAMLLPPLEIEPQDGLAVYPDPPRLEDLSEDRGGFQAGQRTELVTYIIQHDGNYRLPSITISWWDLNARRLREASVPAVSFTAAPNPDYKPEIAIPVDEVEEDTQAPQSPSLRELIARWAPVAGVSLALVFCGIFVGRRVFPRLVAALAEARRRRAASEAAAFAGVKAACHSGDRQSVIRLLYVWLDRAGQGSGPETIASVIGSSRDLDLQCRALFLGDSAWDGPSFAALLERARRQSREVQRQRSDGCLPPLNPTV